MLYNDTHVCMYDNMHVTNIREDCKHARIPLDQFLTLAKAITCAKLRREDLRTCTCSSGIVRHSEAFVCAWSSCSAPLSD